MFLKFIACRDYFPPNQKLVTNDLVLQSQINSGRVGFTWPTLNLAGLIIAGVQSWFNISADQTRVLTRARCVLSRKVLKGIRHTTRWPRYWWKYNCHLHLTNKNVSPTVWNQLLYNWFDLPHLSGVDLNFWFELANTYSVILVANGPCSAMWSSMPPMLKSLHVVKSQPLTTGIT